MDELSTMQVYDFLRQKLGYGNSKACAILNIKSNGPSAKRAAVPRNKNRKHHRRRSDAGTTKDKCATCGTACSFQADRCALCRPAYLEGYSEGMAAARTQILVREADVSSRVPTVDDAAKSLYIGRSQAAEMVQRAFGKDPRNGVKQRAERREYKEASIG